MALYLVQHGLSLPRDVDPEQGLSDAGKIEMQRVAVKARELGINVSRIIHSGKTRARQTAETFAALLTPGRIPIEEPGLNPMDDVTAFAGKLRTDEDLMVVGHLPFLERLAAHLVTGSADRAVIRFRNAGVVCMEFLKDQHSWVILWSFTPEMA